MIDRSDLLRPADIAKLAGVDSSTVANWRRRHDDFPPPSQGTERMFDRAAVVKWLRQRGMLADSDAIGVLRASGIRDLEPLALEVAAIAAVLDGADGLGASKPLPAKLAAAMRVSMPLGEFAVLLDEVISLAEIRWASSGNTPVTLFPLLRSLGSDAERAKLVRDAIPEFFGEDRWALLAGALSAPATQFADFVADTILLPETGHLIDLAAGTGDTVLEVAARRPMLTLSAIVESDEAVRAVGLRAIARGLSVRIVAGDLATAEVILADKPADVIVSSAIGRVGAASIRYFEGGLLTDQDFGLAALLGAPSWLAPGGVAAIAAEQWVVSDLPDYRRAARDLVLNSGTTAAIVALPDDFREALPILWILQDLTNDFPRHEVVMVDARSVAAFDSASLNEVKGATRYALSGEDEDFDTWNDSERAAAAFTKDLIGTAATVEPGYWAPPEGHADWNMYRDLWSIKSFQSLDRLLASLTDEPIFNDLRPRYGSTPGPVTVRLDALVESGAISLERGNDAHGEPSVLGSATFARLADFDSSSVTLNDHDGDNGIAKDGDVILSVVDGRLHAAVLEAGHVRVGRDMWIIRVHDDAIDPAYLAMTVNSAWGQRVSRLTDRGARNDPRRVEITLVDIDAQRELGAEYRRLVRLSADFRFIADEVDDVLELFTGNAATGEVRLAGPIVEAD